MYSPKGERLSPFRTFPLAVLLTRQKIPKPTSFDSPKEAKPTSILETEAKQSSLYTHQRHTQKKANYGKG